MLARWRHCNSKLLCKVDINGYPLMSMYDIGHAFLFRCTFSEDAHPVWLFCMSFKKTCLISMIAMICDRMWDASCRKQAPSSRPLPVPRARLARVTVETVCQKVMHRTGPMGCGDDMSQTSSIIIYDRETYWQLLKSKKC